MRAAARHVAKVVLEKVSGIYEAILRRLKAGKGQQLDRAARRVSNAMGAQIWKTYPRDQPDAAPDWPVDPRSPAQGRRRHRAQIEQAKDAPGPQRPRAAQRAYFAGIDDDRFERPPASTLGQISHKDRLRIRRLKRDEAQKRPLVARSSRSTDRRFRRMEQSALNQQLARKELMVLGDRRRASYPRL